MPAVKTAISLPADVYEQLDVEARRQGASRSAIVLRAIEAYLERLDIEAYRREVDAAYAEPLDEDELRTLRGFQRLSAQALRDE